MATKKTTKKAEEKKPATKAAEAAKVTEEKKAAPAKKEAAKTAPAKKETKKAAPAKKEAAKAAPAKKETKKAAPAKKETKKAAKKPAEKALLATAVKGLFFEYGEKQVDASALAELAKADYKANGGKAAIKGIELYVKAEDNALYYVINGKDSGKVEL
ncbi:MAG: hypothetical protein E7517_06665 [Ruminococcaceae bacterium]|nr:hypothetical protein [Oscillospiraceae bacterium]